ncbi:MAG: type II secretion system protein [Firmicutes bacterium]|nr:type II secretion system protein [Bacillota bacterium]
MFKKRNEKGFTLAELLIVVAIIAVLVAIAIPIFTAQLDKAKLATDTANARAAVAELVATALTDEGEVTDSDVQAAVSGAMTKGCTATAADGTVTVKSPKGKTNTFTYDTGSFQDD